MQEVYKRWADEMDQYALIRPKPLRGNSTVMRMFIPEPSDEPIEASQLASALHHRLLLHHQSTRIQEDQSSLFHPNQVTELTLRIMAPRPNILTVIAENCPNLRVLTVYDGVDFQPSHHLEVPCRFASDWAAGLAGLHTIECFTYVWTLDNPHDGAIEAPGRTRLATRCASSLSLPFYHLNSSSIDGTKTPKDALFQFSVQTLQASKRSPSLSFAHSLPIKATVGKRCER